MTSTKAAPSNRAYDTGKAPAESAAAPDPTWDTRESLQDQASSTRPGLAHQVFGYFGVSAMQTVLEFGVFTMLHLLSLPDPVPSALSIICSGTFNFAMNRNLTFKSTSNLTRSVVLFVLLYLWNFVFLQLMLGVLPSSFGWDPVVVKFFTMACQGVWGFLLSKFVIFR